jgi:ribosome-associated toxin RatA of RatAB toxin-antitoxin module
MKHVRKSVLLWYSAHEMYELVTAIEQYPQFLPWCAGTQLIEHHGDGVTARIQLAYMGVQHAFTTRNQHVRDEAVTVSLVDGPFSLLDGTWLFKKLVRPGHEAEPGDQQACKIEFDLRYAFARGPLEAVVSPVFDRIANSFVDAFVRRAEEVYGAR